MLLSEAWYSRYWYENNVLPLLSSCIQGNVNFYAVFVTTCWHCDFIGGQVVRQGDKVEEAVRTVGKRIVSIFH